MNENEFWLGIWKVLGTVVVLITVSIGGCSSYATSKVSEAISNGVNPLEVTCAINGTNNSVCTILAAQK